MQIKEPFEKPVQFTEEAKKAETLVNLGPLGKAGPTVAAPISPAVQFREAPVKEGVEQFGERPNLHHKEVLSQTGFKHHSTKAGVSVFKHPSVPHREIHVYGDGAWESHNTKKQSGTSYSDAQAHGTHSSQLSRHINSLYGKEL